MACARSRSASKIKLIMLALSDQQMQAIKDAARDVPLEKRGQFLERIAAMLAMRCPFSDGDVADVVSLALCGLIHHADTATS
jgi:hypothetical protein